MATRWEHSGLAARRSRTEGWCLGRSIDRTMHRPIVAPSKGHALPTEKTRNARCSVVGGLASACVLGQVAFLSAPLMCPSSSVVPAATFLVLPFVTCRWHPMGRSFEPSVHGTDLLSALAASRVSILSDCLGVVGFRDGMLRRFDERCAAIMLRVFGISLDTPGRMGIWSWLLGVTPHTVAATPPKSSSVVVDLTHARIST